MPDTKTGRPRPKERTRPFDLDKLEVGGSIHVGARMLHENRPVMLSEIKRQVR